MELILLLDFVCHEKSPAVLPQGWCRTVGHDISGPSGYNVPALKDVTLQMLINYDNMPKVTITEGMRLEAVDPLHPSYISAATVKKVLKHGYIMISIDGKSVDKRNQAAFCYHVTSPLIFPCGFCEKRSLKLLPPKDYKGDSSTFTWDKYASQVKIEKLPIQGLRRDDTVNHGIKVGMKLEAVDIMEPHLICAATVSKVVGRLLKISFDGWDEEFDQWMDVKSADLFPCGWCEIEKYTLQFPPGIPKPPALTSNGHNSSNGSKKNTE